MKKRLIAILLGMTMMLTFMPTMAFAMDSSNNTKGISKSSQDEIYVPFGEDQEILLRSSFSIYPTAELYHEGENEGDEWTEDVPLVNATIVSQHPETQGQVVIELIKGSEEGQYEIESKHYGYAFVEAVYKARDGKEYKNRFKVSVVRITYGLYFDTINGKDTILPGNSIKMKVNAEKQFYTADGEGDEIFADATGELKYEWSSDAQEGDLHIVPDSSDPSLATIYAENDAYGDYEISVVAKNSKGVIVSKERKQIQVYPEFYDIEFIGLKRNMDKDEECEVTLELRRYSTDIVEGFEVIEGVTWDYLHDEGDEDDILIDKISDNKLKLRMLKNQGSYTTVYAYIDDEYITNAAMDIKSTPCSLGFEEARDFVITKDETARTFHLNKEGVSVALAKGYTARFKVGEWRWSGEDADFTGKYYDGCFTVDGINVTLDGRKLHAAGANTICIRAELVKGNNVLEYADLYGDVSGEGNSDEQPIIPNTSGTTSKDVAKTAAALEAASNINKGTVTAADIKKASELGATTVTFGASVKRVSKNAFKGTKITTIVVKTKKLKKGSVKGSLKGSKVKTVKVQIGSKKVNKKYVKKYKKFFTKKNAGKKAKVK